MNRVKSARWFPALAGAAVLLAGVAVAGSSGSAHAAASGPASKAAPASTSTCNLGNGVKHVVQLTFDNVHFFRDNPNVPSDLELMPNLLNFFENNGSFLSNNHTPLIAHTADDILTSFTGMYGDRQGMPGMNNAFRTFNPDGTTDPASAFAY